VLRWRLVSSAVIIAVAVTLVMIDHTLGRTIGYLGLVLAPLALVVTLMGSNEVRRLFTAKGHAARPGVTELGAMLVMGIACVPLAFREYPADCPVGRVGWVALGLLSALGLYVIVEIARYREPGQVIERLAIQSFIALYVGGLMGFLVTLRSAQGNDWGIIAIVHTIAVVKLSDTAAYATGKLIGKRKLTPLLSPGKTVEGAIGALIGGMLASWLVLLLLEWLVFGRIGSIPLVAMLGYGLLVALVGMIGDLAESLMKRDATIKDSSAWMPGLGGLLDVVDSLIAVSPVAAIVWSSDLLGTH